MITDAIRTKCVNGEETSVKYVNMDKREVLDTLPTDTEEEMGPVECPLSDNRMANGRDSREIGTPKTQPQ